jgi:hypothetical protein
MLRFILVNNVETSFTAYNFVIWTDFLDTGTHFHADHSPALALEAMTHCF